MKIHVSATLTVLPFAQTVFRLALAMTPDLLKAAAQARVPSGIKVESVTLREEV